MTRLPGSSPLAVMTLREVRDAGSAGAGLVAFAPSLAEVLWANAPGRAALGLSVGETSLEATSVVARQIKASARLLDSWGEARILIRSTVGRSSKAVVATLQRIDSADLVLLTLPDMRPTAVSDVAWAGSLLADSRLETAAIYDADGALAATAAFQATEGLAEAVAEFVETDDSLGRFDDASIRMTLALVGKGLVLVQQEPLPAAGDPSAEAAPEPEDMPTQRSYFSVKRRRLSSERGSRMSMNGLLQRWHTRQTGVDLPGDPEEPPIDEPAADAPAEQVAPPSMPPADMAQSAIAAAEASAQESFDVLPEPEDAEDVEAAAPDPVESQLLSENVEVPLPEPSTAQDLEAASPVDLGAVSAEEPVALSVEATDADDRSHEPDSGASSQTADAETAETLDVLSGSDEEAASATEPAEEASSELSTEAMPTVDIAAATAVAPAATFVPRFDIAPVRFVWQIDRDGKFRSLTPEFSGAVGPHAADVAGRSFREVATVFGFDDGGEIARLLDRRDTWSGRSILWPVEGSDRKVPVDLAALPIYARDRSFDGFRGFGIVRMNEWVVDAEAIGMILGNQSVAVESASRRDIEPAPSSEAPGTVPDPTAQKPLLTTFEATTFGRRPIAPVIPEDADVAPAGPDMPKVIRLEERRRPKEGSLSHAEEAAFRAIGLKLGDRGTVPPVEDAMPVAGQEAPHEDDGLGGNPGAAQAQGAMSDPEATLAFPATNHASPWASDEIGPVSADTPDEAAAISVAIEGDAGVDAGVPAISNAEVDDPEEVTVDADAEEAALAADLEAVFASLPLPVLAEAHGRLLYANREFQDLTGYESIAALKAAGGLESLFAERGDPQRTGELAIRRSNGQEVEVRVHMQRATFNERSSLLMSFTPSPRDAVAAVLPPADTAAAPETADLRQQVEELQAVLDTATDGIVLLDPAGTIRTMNGSAQALFGSAQDDHGGRHLSTLFAHESQKATLDYLDMLRDDGLAGILNDGREVIGRVAQGGFIPLFITIGRLSGERGWCVVIRDIAHWKRIEEDLVNARRQAEAASLHKSRFLANISHELRTPLNAIIGFADVMASECFGPIGNERYLEYLGDIKRSGHHVLDLVNDLLDISKIEAGKLDLAFEAVSLNEVVSEVVSLMQPQANRERVIVRSNLPSSVPPVVADRRTMRQIALNLVANAIRFTPAGGQIIASTTYTADGDVLLRFRDSGIGMTEREIEIALTPFQQVHAPSANRGEGTGLGLPLTKAMVEANRAQFAISSTPNEGTLVEIAFPSQRVLAD